MSRRADWFGKLVAVSTLCLALGCFLMAQEGRAASAESSPVIVVLPFQINAGPELRHLEVDFPAMLSQTLASRGLRVVPQENMVEALRRSSVSSMGAAEARKIASAAKASFAVYGAVNQAGDALSIDARLVPLNGEVRPFFIDRAAGGQDMTKSVNELANRIAGQFAPKDAVAGIEVRGTKVLDPDVVLLRLNTRTGDKIDPAGIDEEVKRIWDLGYFSDVNVNVEHRADGLFLVYTVAEKPRIENIAIEGASEIDAEDIRAAMNTKQGSVLNERTLADDIQKIIEMYRKDGYYLAKVDSRVDGRAAGASASLVLTIDEGKKLYISQVHLDGAEQLSESDIKGDMMISERWMFSWITGSGVLKEELIERDSSAIAAYYLNRGFLDVVVGAPVITHDDDGIIVTFPIKEGTRYKLGDVTFSGDLIVEAEKLHDLVALDEMAKNGEYFRLGTMQEDQTKLMDFYAKHGYGYADINPTPKKRGEEAVVDVDYYLGKKQKLFVGRVTVEGNNKTRDNVILREMRLTDGDNFDGDKLRRSNERLNKLGYFEMAEVEVVPTKREDEVDLKVRVKEKPTGALMAGVGYSTFSSFGVSGTLMERNLFGKGYTAQFLAGFNARRNAYQFTFANPRWNDSDLYVALDLYHWRDDYIDYRKRTTGGNIRFAYPLGEYTTLGWGYRFDQYKIYDLDDDVSSLIARYDTGDRYSSVGQIRLTRDTTDRMNPTSGNIDRISLDYGGGFFGGDDDFVTVTLEHQTYYELWQNHVLHARVKAAAVFENGSNEVPVFERFWMGGINSVRGYDSRDIVPRDPLTGDRIGGTRMAFANFEYIWTFSPEIGVALVPFFDIGINADDDRSWKWDDELLRSFGAELRWRSPMGDLRFSYGIPLDEDRKGRKEGGRFEFAMGQQF